VTHRPTNLALQSDLKRGGWPMVQPCKELGEIHRALERLHLRALRHRIVCPVSHQKTGSTHAKQTQLAGTSSRTCSSTASTSAVLICSVSFAAHDHHLSTASTALGGLERREQTLATVFTRTSHFSNLRALEQPGPFAVRAIEDIFHRLDPRVCHTNELLGLVRHPPWAADTTE
jgi:hypothetical protein